MKRILQDVNNCQSQRERNKHTALLRRRPCMPPTMIPVVAPVATKGSASCAWGGSRRHVSSADCFTDVMKGFRKSTSTCTAPDFSQTLSSLQNLHASISDSTVSLDKSGSRLKGYRQSIEEPAPGISQRGIWMVFARFSMPLTHPCALLLKSVVDFLN